jgi:hypothetical protein
VQSARVQKRVSETQKRVDNARLFDSVLQIQNQGSIRVAICLELGLIQLLVIFTFFLFFTMMWTLLMFAEMLA